MSDYIFLLACFVATYALGVIIGRMSVKIDLEKGDEKEKI